MKIKSFAIFLSGIALSVGAAVSGGLIASSMDTNQTKASVQSGWTRVTSVSEITDGGTFIIGYEATANSDIIVPLRSDGAVATTSANGLLYSGTTAGSATNGTINMSSIADTSPYEVAITASSTTTGAVNIALTSGNFIGNPNAKNTARLYASVGTNADYTPAIGENDVVTLTCPASTTYPYLQYNTGSPRFCNYNGSQKHVVLYKEGTAAVLSSLAVSGTLVKTTYYVGDSFEVQGLTITATYDDLSTKDVTSECTFSPSVLTEGLTSVTATYVEGEVTKTAVIEGITVSTRSVVSISVLTNPTKMSYTIGQSFDPAGMIIRATYSAGPTNDNYSAYTYNPTAAFDSLGSKTVTIISTDNASATTSIEITVVDKVEGTYGITSGATVYTSPMDPALLVINKSDSNLPSINFSDISANVRLFGSPITGSIMIGNGSASGGSFKMTLDSGLYVSKIEFVGNDKDVSAAGTATLSVNNASVSFSNIPAEDSVVLKPYTNSITITTTARLWVEQIIVTAQFASTSATDYGTHFLTCTSGECLAGNVSSATWANLQSIFANADTSIQSLIKAASANQGGTDLEHAIARYGVIVEKYGYTDFLALGYSSVGNIHFNNSSNTIVMILVSGTALLAGVSFIYFFLKKKHN